MTVRGTVPDPERRLQACDKAKRAGDHIRMHGALLLRVFVMWRHAASARYASRTINLETSLTAVIA